LRALVSVTDRRGIEEFAKGLSVLGVELLATPGTRDVLERAGVKVTGVEQITGFDVLLEGRVKTIHPLIAAAILADRNRPRHLAQLAELGVEPIDLVVCNFKPFAESPSAEMIDIGGPMIVRAAAKAHQHVVVLVDPEDYGWVLDEIRARGQLEEASRRRLAAKAFSLTSSYDAEVSAWLAGEDAELPEMVSISLSKLEELRYGENPHQRAALYRASRQCGGWSEARLLGGKPLSYCNVLDAEAAWQLAVEIGGGDPAAVVVKHASPCGAATAASVAEAARLALEGDPLSAFGGVLGVAGFVDLQAAMAIAGGPQLDVVVAHGFSEEALHTLSARRKATRLLEAGAGPRPRLEARVVAGAVLLQSADGMLDGPSDWQLVAGPALDAEGLADLDLAWRVAARSLSNAVVLARSGQVVGVGSGQPARVEAARLATSRAGERSTGAVAASDGFFPFPDGLECLAAAGVVAAVAPAGSIRDGEVISSAKKLGVSLYFSSRRHFRH
jgi:phosphoribosylaminoimidazolecarboxamide formyltransferase/IMP cyclohydrolase